jgi:hypothetical protein
MKRKWDNEKGLYERDEVGEEHLFTLYYVYIRYSHTNVSLLCCSLEERNAVSVHAIKQV